MFMDENINGGTQGRVLVGIAAGDRPYHALVRGYQVAKASDAELAVVRVLEDPRPLNWMLFPQRHADDVADAIVRDLETISNGAAWCDQVLPEPLGDRYIVRRGQLIDQLAEEAARAATRLIVLPAGFVEARHAVELANDLQIPVLLARPRRTNPLVVAATDLRHPDYPVLNEAAELAPALAARLLCIHNRAPLLPGIDPMTAMFLPITPIAIEQAYGDARALRAAAASVDRDADAMVTGQSRPVDAILDVARAQDADLIVVGAARHGSIYRWLTGSTAAAVVRRAKRSVLLTPLDRSRSGDRDANQGQ